MQRAIFVSYRRDDAEGEAGRLYDDLSRAFGADSVFIDVAGIAPGIDFRKAIDDNVAACAVFLALIGPRWTSITLMDGSRRLDNQNDFVRLEVASALSRNITVIPVLVHGAEMPTEEQLPENLRDLAYRNGIQLSHARWTSDVDLLVRAIKPYIVAHPERDGQPAAPLLPARGFVRERTLLPSLERSRDRLILGSAVCLGILLCAYPLYRRISEASRASEGQAATGGRDGPVAANRTSEVAGNNTPAIDTPVGAGLKTNHSLPHTAPSLKGPLLPFGLIRTLKEDEQDIWSLAFSPGGSTLAVGESDGSVEVWDTATGTRSSILKGHTDAVTGVSFSPDGRTLASAARNDSIVLWDMQTQARVHRLRTAPKVISTEHSSISMGDEYWSIAFSPDGQVLASGHRDSVRFWDVASGTLLRVVESGARAFQVVFSPDGHTLAAGEASGAIRLFDVATGDRTRTLSGHKGEIKSLAFSPDGRTLTSASDDKTVKVWDMATGGVLKTFGDEEKTPVSVAFSHGGQTLITRLEGDGVLFQEVATGKTLHTISLPGSGEMALSPDGHLLAGAANRSSPVKTALGLWNVAGIP